MGFKKKNDVCKLIWIRIDNHVLCEQVGFVLGGGGGGERDYTSSVEVSFGCSDRYDLGSFRLPSLISWLECYKLKVRHLNKFYVPRVSNAKKSEAKYKNFTFGNWRNRKRHFFNYFLQASFKSKMAGCCLSKDISDSDFYALRDKK